MQTFSSNIVSLPVTDTVGALQRYNLDGVTQEDSGVETVNNDVSYRRQRLKKANIVKSNKSHWGFPSSIMCLPTEILSRIFFYCLPDDECLSPSLRLAPIQTSGVCRRWRDIAVDMPSLWCSLRLEYGKNDWQQRAFCYDTILKRSRGHTLSLALEGYNDQLRRLLQPYSPQIPSLSLHMSTDDVSPLRTAHFPALREVTIYMPIPLRRFLSKVPRKVHTLRIKNVKWCDHAFLSSLGPLAWTHLRHLEIKVMGLDAFLLILRLCPNLSSLTMTGWFLAMRTPVPFTHSNLHTLRICGSFFTQWSPTLGLFDAITLPNLRTLEARNMDGWFHEEFMNFLTRSACQLERLTCSGGTLITDVQRAEYTTLIPSLEIVGGSDPVFKDFYF
ncbi:hypothetical protein EDB19DRAFT_1918962 [Suillus lakei]|nr:hypothetical protein EDB19DRAFT_1918962 [Suillus lakei]